MPTYLEGVHYWCCYWHAWIQYSCWKTLVGRAFSSTLAWCGCSRSFAVFGCPSCGSKYSSRIPDWCCKQVMVPNMFCTMYTLIGLPISFPSMVFYGSCQHRSSSVYMSAYINSHQMYKNSTFSYASGFRYTSINLSIQHSCVCTSFCAWAFELNTI